MTIKATIAHTKLIDIKGRLDKVNDKFIAKWVLVDCRTGEQVIQVEFYKSRGYRCDVFITANDLNDLHLVGSARGGSKTEALVTAFKKVGVTFGSELHEACPDYHFCTPINLVVNAIADALEIPPKRRTIVPAESEDIHAR